MTEKQKEIHRDKVRRWRQRNPELNKERAKVYRKNRREKKLQENRVWKNANREKLRAYAKAAYHSDESVRFSILMRTRVRNALKGRIKSSSFLHLLGCTIPELKAHLESLFQPGMTWENRGKFGWHVDHCRPCASFDLTDPEQQKQCFHYTNLQPMWWKENLSKSTKWFEV